MTMEPELLNEIGHDAREVWLDFWELAGGIRVDVIRRVETGGIPEKMIPPVITETTIRSVKAIVLEPGNGSMDRSGSMNATTLKLELLTEIRHEDAVSIGGYEYTPDSITVKDMGIFRLWIVELSRSA